MPECELGQKKKEKGRNGIEIGCLWKVSGILHCKRMEGGKSFNFTFSLTNILSLRIHNHVTSG